MLFDYCENCVHSVRKQYEEPCLRCECIGDSVPTHYVKYEKKDVEKTSKEKDCTNCIYENFDINDVPCKHCEYGGGADKHYVEQTCKYCKHDSRADWEEPCVDCTITGEYEHFRLAEHYKPKEHETEEENNAVQHPAHYQSKYECIDEMRALFGDEAVKGFCKCNAYKYRFRAGKKQGEEYEKDIAKAEWYMEYLMRLNGHDEEL